MLESLRSIKPITLREQVFDEIQRAILELRLKPGDHIREQEIAKALEVSRAPVREALVLLERDGLVKISPNRGCFVRKFNKKDIREIFALRIGLENLAARLIIDKLTEQDFEYLEALIQEQRESIAMHDTTEASTADLAFHLYLVNLADNSRLLRSWQSIAMQYTLLRWYTQTTGLDQNRGWAIKSHQAILEGLRARDVDQVAHVNWDINNRMADLCVEAYLLYRGQGQG